MGKQRFFKRTGNPGFAVLRDKSIIEDIKSFVRSKHEKDKDIYHICHCIYSVLFGIMIPGGDMFI